MQLWNLPVNTDRIAIKAASSGQETPVIEAAAVVDTKSLDKYSVAWFGACSVGEICTERLALFDDSRTFLMAKAAMWVLQAEPAAAAQCLPSEWIAEARWQFSFETWETNTSHGAVAWPKQNTEISSFSIGCEEFNCVSVYWTVLTYYINTSS